MYYTSFCKHCHSPVTLETGFGTRTTQPAAILRITGKAAVRLLFKSFCTCALCGTYPYLMSVSDFTDLLKNRRDSIKLCWNKSKKMPRLNNDEGNQPIGMLNAGMSATVVLRHFGLHSKDYRAFTETILCHRNVLEVVGHVSPLLPMIAISSCSTYVTDVWLQQ